MSQGTPKAHKRSGLLVWSGVAVHGALVLFACLAAVISAADNQNIGAPFATVPLAALGFPWSVILGTTGRHEWLLGHRLIARRSRLEPRIPWIDHLVPGPELTDSCPAVEVAYGALSLG